MAKNDTKSTNFVGALYDRVDTPLLKGVVAAGITATVIASTTAFGPIGVVGAGWSLVYGVGIGTTVLDGIERYTGFGRDA